MSQASVRAVTRWTTRVIPFVLAGCVGFTTYVLVKNECVDYLINETGQDGAAIAILILYFVFFLLMLITYLRTFLMIKFDTGVVPYGPTPAESKRDRRKRLRGEKSMDTKARTRGPDPDPDSPGLENFYRRIVFVAEQDGRPRYCSECGTWKPDRAHHSTEINRCVYKMDHYCPWVGGMVSETSFKFFVQFTGYTALYCSVVMASSAYCLHGQIRRGDSLDGTIIAAIALAGFFGLFTFLMTVTSFRFIFINLTNVDVIRAKTMVYQLAVRVPLGTPSTPNYATVTYPLPRAGQKESSTDSGSSRDTTSSRELRDLRAARTFAILRTEPGENPWDLGWYRNWQSVMGTNVVDYILPIRRSPCTKHDSTQSMYRMGKLLPTLKHRYGLQHLPEAQYIPEIKEMGSRV